ncbi:unnamed protein product [Brachionus calyciflorus]|uniref:Uncharacterized protein n=1 Tax=Brachionus calyciflorus TaxID=104777 RepID=A0A813YKF3_9BILA|nr:unnamed protein product [Brachionus calyciflorus]
MAKFINKVLFIIITFFLYVIIFIENYFRPSHSFTNQPKSAYKSIKSQFRINSKHNSSEKWIVVTSVSAPTEQCIKLSKIPGFKLLVVGDLKTNDSWKLENAIYLSVKTQESLGFQIFESLPFNSYTRKNIGYLYAIAHGAKFIYDTDDDNAPSVDLNTYFSFNDYDKGLIYDCSIEQKVINPYAHFGQPLIWPRGFPLYHIEQNYQNSYVSSNRRKVSIVQQGVVNGDPDVDAIFRLTKTMKFNKIDLYFDSSSPSFQIPLYKMSPYNSQNTLISYNGFWSLYLPKSVSFRLTDIWRSYWAQRLMWLLNETVSFNGPSAYQLRNAHSYLKDFELENAMYLQTEQYVDFLYEWRCKYDTFYKCMLQLSEEMAFRDFWNKSEVISIENWIHDLQMIGYKEPKIINYEHKKTDIFLKCEHLFNDFDKTRVRYTPEFQKPIEIQFYKKDNSFDLSDSVDHFKYFQNMCQKYNITLSNKYLYNSPKQESYSILITFNHEPIEENIIILDNLYKKKFKNIIYCGKQILTKLSGQRGMQKRFDSYTFIELINYGIGEFHYYCMNKAIEMGYKTDGFFLLSDDVLFKYWNVQSFKTNKIWFPFKLLLQQDSTKDIDGWQNHFISLRNSWAYLENIIKNEGFSLKEKDLAKQYLNYIEMNQDSNSTLINVKKMKICGSDTFYIPKEKFDFFYFVTDVFRMHSSLLEIAVPNIIAGLEKYDQNEFMDGVYIWDRSIHFNFSQYDTYVHFYHPFKLSYLKRDMVEYNYCSFYLREAFN